MPKVSIIVPTYQHEKFLSICLASIIDQTFTDWEAIVVDDGSTDATQSIAKDFQAKDQRIHYYYQKNKGIYRLSELYNFALEKAEGELIAVLEGDDYWPADKLQLQVPAFDSEQVGLVWGDGMIDHNGSLTEFPGMRGNYSKQAINNSPIGSAIPEFVLSGRYFTMPTCSVMYRKDALQSINGFYQPKDLPWLDKSTWALLACVTQFRYLPANLGVWRQHAAQVTKNNTDTRTTFDFVFSDPDCPHALKTRIADYRNEHDILTSYIRLYRERKPKQLVTCITRSITKPVAAFKNVRRYFSTRINRRKAS